MPTPSLTMSHDLSAIGPSKAYIGLEVIPTKADQIQFTSDEVTAVCPITGQPDYYGVSIILEDTDYTLESKALKLYLGTFRNEGIFAEDLASQILFSVVEKVGNKGTVSVTVTQKSRGGISLAASCFSYAKARP